MNREEDLGRELLTLWEAQKAYNDKVGKITPRENPARWSEVLLLGMVTEIYEVLKVIGWKRHRGDTTKPSKVSYSNLAFELGDLTKYVFSLWQIWGFDVETMLLETYRKSTVMDLRLQQEFVEPPCQGSKVLLVDIDGTLADLRWGLWDWACQFYGYGKSFTEPLTLNADVDLGIDYRKFQRIKEDFTEREGFLSLLPLKAACRAVLDSIKNGVYVIACTARPADKHPRLWLETWAWLEDQGLGGIKQLHIGDDARIKLLLDLADKGCDIVLFDDDPGTVERALNSGVRVVLPRYPYNSYLWKRSNVYPVDARNGRTKEAFAKAGIGG